MRVILANAAEHEIRICGAANFAMLGALLRNAKDKHRTEVQVRGDTFSFTKIRGRQLGKSEILSGTQVLEVIKTHLKLQAVPANALAEITRGLLTQRKKQPAKALITGGSVGGSFAHFETA